LNTVDADLSRSGIFSGGSTGLTAGIFSGKNWNRKKRAPRGKFPVERENGTFQQEPPEKFPVEPEKKELFNRNRPGIFRLNRKNDPDFPDLGSG